MLHKDSAEIKEIEKFFDILCNDFDSIYTGNQPKQAIYSKIIGHFFRKSVYLRFKETFKALGDIQNKKILDLGCGTGVYAVGFAKKGAVVACLDISQNMLDIARKRAIAHQVERRCHFVRADFLDYLPKTRFNSVVAMGFFDYVRNPIPVLKKIISMCDNSIAISFPVKFHWLMPQRKFRYWLKKCPLYFYSMRDIRRIMHICNIQNYKIKKIARDYFVFIQCNSKT